MQKPTSLARCFDIDLRPLFNSDSNGSGNSLALHLRWRVQQPQIPREPAARHRADPGECREKRKLVAALEVVTVDPMALPPDQVYRLGLAGVAEAEPARRSGGERAQALLVCPPSHAWRDARLADD